MNQTELEPGSIVLIVAILLFLLMFGLVMGHVFPDSDEKRRREKAAKQREDRAKAMQMLRHAEKIEKRAQRLAEKKIEDAIVEQRAQEIVRDTLERAEENEDS